MAYRDFANDKNKGITRILVHDNPTWADICEQIAPSEVNRNLDLLISKLNIIYDI